MLSRRTYGKICGLKPKLVQDNIQQASLVWWSNMKKATVINRLDGVQRLPCQGLAGAMRTTSTSAVFLVKDFLIKTSLGNT